MGIDFGAPHHQNDKVNPSRTWDYLHECENFPLIALRKQLGHEGAGGIELFHCWPSFTLKSNLYSYEINIASLSRNPIKLDHLGCGECHILNLTRKAFTQPSNISSTYPLYALFFICARWKSQCPASTPVSTFMLMPSWKYSNLGSWRYPFILF